MSAGSAGRHDAMRPLPLLWGLCHSPNIIPLASFTRALRTHAWHARTHTKRAWDRCTACTRQRVWCSTGTWGACSGPHSFRLDWASLPTEQQRGWQGPSVPASSTFPCNCLCPLSNQMSSAASPPCPSPPPSRPRVRCLPGRYREMLIMVETCQAATLLQRIRAPNVITVACSLKGKGQAGCGGGAGRIPAPQDRLCRREDRRSASPRLRPPRIRPPRPFPHHNTLAPSPGLSPRCR